MNLRENITVGEMLAETVCQHPKRNAVEYLGQYWTYEELDRITDRIALHMLHLGINKGSKAGIWANDCPNTLFCFLALEKIGGIPVMLNTSWTAGEIQRQLEWTEVEYLFYDEGYKNTDFVEICEKLDLPLLRKKIFIGQSASNFNIEEMQYMSDGWNWGTGQHGEKIACVQEAVEAETVEVLEQAKSKVQANDVDVILFTSGSTSTSKAVVTTHFSRANNVYAQAEMIRAGCEDVFCVAIPMFHCFSLSGNVLAALAVGACICFPESRKTDHIYAAIERAGCTILTAVPTLYSALMANPRRKQYCTASLRTGLVGGAGCSVELFCKVCKELQVELLPSLGQTEATAGITVGKYTDSLEIRAASAGYLIEHLEGKIVDIKNGYTCKARESGELCIRGYNVMQGYYKQPKLTSQTIDKDGFLHTGDLGYFDEAGRLYLTGRLKELIIRGGENIAPGEIEQVILKDDRVEQVKVLGVPDEHYGEEVCACIVLKNTKPEAAGEKILEERMTASYIMAEIQQLVSVHLAAYKVPRYVLFLKELPLTGNGKIDMAALKKMVKEKCL